MDKYPGVIFTGVISTTASIALTIYGIQVGVALRDRKPRAVQQAKSWMLAALAWSIVSLPLSFASGLDSEALLASGLKGIVVTAISFGIWYSYFNVSERVRATYPDWKQE